MRKSFYHIFSVAILVFFCILIPSQKVSAATGFLGGPMWIDPEVPSQGDMVSLSALFHNAEVNQLSGEVSFYDGNVLLGQKTITIVPGGVSTATVTFSIGAGDHNFSASTGSMHITLSSGIVQVFAMALETVSLPKINVPSNAGSSLTASVTSGVTNNTYNSYNSNSTNNQNPANPLLAQIDSAQNKVLSVLPDSIKTPILDTASSVDSWRAKNSGVMVQSASDAADSLKKINALIDSQQKNFGKVEPSDKYINRPFAYVKLFFYNLMSFLYSHPVFFYLLAFLTLGIVIRFLYRKIFRSRRDEY